MAKEENTNCMSLTVAARRVIDFKVEAYSVASKMAVPGQSFQPDTFHVGGYDWALRFSPGQRVSFELELASNLGDKEKEYVGVNFAVTLLDEFGEPSAAAAREKGFSFELRGQVVYIELMSKEDLAKFIHGDCFVVRCTVSVLRKPSLYSIWVDSTPID